eukprot:m.21872 g.21872  ORF g.21872 m.21872 type:complete len:499 (+) comp13590_c0_seq1:256-1752(+)
MRPYAVLLCTIAVVNVELMNINAEWCNYTNVNDVSNVHNASTVLIANVSSADLCQAHAIAKSAPAYTWHDGTVERYAFACVLRVDGVWAPVAQTHHYSGLQVNANTPCPPPPSPPTPPPTPNKPKCSLNGELNASGGCVCDAGWIGANCGQLNLDPAPTLSQQVTPNAAMTLNNTVANSTWGISVVGFVDGAYHGYMTEIANACELGDYGTASQVIHMSAPSPLGPWTRVGVALAGFAHNPQAFLAPNGSVVLFHIGAELPPGCLLNCTTGAGPRPPSCPALTHDISVAVADSVNGPFRRFPYFLQRKLTNPSAMLLENGTVVLVGRRATLSQQPTYIGNIDHIEGPWTAVNTVVIGAGAIFEEDPFLYKGARGYHMLTHREVQSVEPIKSIELKDSGLTDGIGVPPITPAMCGGGHLFSPDLLTWWYGEDVYGQADTSVAQCMITFSPNIRTKLTSRQRPTVFEDVKNGARYLYNGASVNISEYSHSFTLVQQIKLS